MDFPLAVIPVLMGPLQVLLALLPAILAALLGLVVAVFRPSALLGLVRFLWHQKLFTLGLTALLACYFMGIPSGLLGKPASAAGDAAAVDSSEEWPVFRGGPARLGSAGGGDPTLGAAVWSARRDMTVFSSPAVCGDRVYVSTVFGISPFNLTGKGAILCLDAHSGEELWRFAPADYRGTFSSPVVKDGRLVCGEGLHQTENARITCLDLAGRRLWQFTTGSHVESTAAIAEGRVYIGAGDDGFYCLDLEPAADGTPRVVWHLDPKRFPDCESCPIVADGVVYFGLGEEGQALCAVDAATGQERWRLPTPYPVFAPPTIVDGKLYMAMGNGNFVQSAEDLLAAHVEKMKEEGKSPQEIEAAKKRLAPAGEIWCIDLVRQAVDWKLPLPQTVLGAIACRDGRLYFGSRDGHCYYVSTAGAVLHKFNARDVILGSPAVGAEQVYFATQGGRLFALRAESLEPLWDVSLGRQSGLCSSPALAHGHLYVGTDAGLRCVGVAEPPPPPLWTAGERGGLSGREPLPKAGKVAWRYPEEEIEGFRVTAPLMPLEDFLYAAVLEEGKPQLVKLRTDADLADDARRVWSAALADEIALPPAGLGHRLYVVEGRAGQRGALRCLSAKDGHTLWSQPLEAAATGQLTLDFQRLYAWTGPKTLACFDAASGRPLWRSSSLGAGVGAPAVVGDILLVSLNDAVGALDAETGTLLWRRAERSLRFGPVPAGNGFLLVAKDQPQGETVSLRELTDGSTKWQTPVHACLSPPAVAGEFVVVMSDRPEGVLVLSLSDGRKMCACADQASAVPAPLHQGRFLCHKERTLIAVDVASGESTPWLDLAEAGRPMTPFVGQADQAYFATEHEGIVCVRPKTP
jgi:outer membrane protein assembly factor BamB